MHTNTLRRFIHNIKDSTIELKGIFVFEILYKIMGVFIVLPTLLGMLNISLRLAGYKYIGSDNYLDVVKNPITITMFIIMSCFIAFYILVEIAFITIYCDQCYKGVKPNSLRCFNIAVKTSVRLFIPKNIFIGVLLLIFIPLLCIVLSSGLWTTVKIPQFVLNYIHKLLNINKIFLVSIAVLLITAMQSIFSLHYFILEKQSFIKSIYSSKKLLNGKTLRVIIIMIFSNILLGIGIFLVYGFTIAVTLCILSTMDNSNLALVMFLSIFRILVMTIIFLIGVLAIPINYIIISTLYYKYIGTQRYIGLNELECKVKLSCMKRNWGNGLIILLSIVLVLNVFYINAIINNDIMYDINILRATKITAHRGSSQKAPENTLSSIQYAIDDFSDYIEIDVQETKDGTIILLHDSNFKRVSGVNKNVWDVTYEEISTLDVGSWFSEDFQHERVPTLEEAIDMVNDKVRLNIEIKTNSRNENLVESVVGIIKSKDFKEKCIITSQNYDVLKKVKKLDKEIKTGYILKGAYGKFYGLSNVDLFSLEGSFVTKKMVDNIHKQNKEVHVWTINTERSIRRAVEMGVDNLITDDPILARKIIFSEDTTAGFNRLLNILFKE